MLWSDWYHAESAFEVPLDQNRAAAGSPDRFKYVGDCRISKGCVAGWYYYYYCSYAVMPFGLAGPSTYLVVQENRIRC